MVITVIDFDSGKEIVSKVLKLQPRQSTRLTNDIEPFKGIIGKVRLYIDCSPTVTATVGNCKGTQSAISWERMAELPFPKFLP